jgi:protein O-GlcNAc transferase
MKVGRNERCPCRSGRKYKDCCILQDAQRDRPQPPSVGEPTRQQLMLAFQAFSLGRVDDAWSACSAILRRHPNQPDALHLQGVVSHSRGQLIEALQLIERAISLAVNGSMHSNRARVLQAMGRLPEAEASYRLAIQLDPQAAAVHCNLGTCLQAQGRWKEAVTVFQACVRLSPRNVHALNGLGYCLAMLEQLPEAEKTLQEAIGIDPAFADARTNLGVTYWAVGRPLDAIEQYRTALSIDPSKADVWDRLGVALGEANFTFEAREAFSRAFEIEPNPIRRLRKTLILSHVYSSHEDMKSQRQAFEAGIEDLIRSGEKVDSLNSHAFCPGIFNLAYHGDDVLPVLRRIATMYEHLCPSLRSRAPHVDHPRKHGSPIRLGFLTTFVFDHPVSRCFAGLVKALALDPSFEVFLISHRDLPHGNMLKPYEGFERHLFKIAKQYDTAREAIAQLELDILVYQDIGMDDLSYFLAYSRLARVQCVLGGHPITTGLPEMDIFVSSALAEHEDSQTHYSEKLFLLDPGIANLERPVLPENFKDRRTLGLPVEGSLYVCPMLLQKIHPDFDTAIHAILSLDLTGHIVFFAHPDAGWEQHLKARMKRGLGEALSERLIVLPWIRNPDDFASVLHHAAVVLDPFHFGIGSTGATVFAVGTPIVTWPSNFLRGRVGLCYSRLLGLSECVAESMDSYAVLAVKIANDESLRLTLSRRIKANSDRLFNSNDYLKSNMNFFQSISDSEATSLM